MSMASVAIRTSNFTITEACAELIAAATIKFSILEFSFITFTATAQTLGFGRPQAIGITPGTTTTPVRDDPGAPACVASMAASWGTSPTVPAVMARRWNLPATAGAGVVFTFPRGFQIAASLSAVWWNTTASVAADLNVAYDE